MKTSFNHLGVAGAVFVLWVLAPGCISDHNYDVDNLKDIDATVTLFSDGMTLPLGQTEKLSLGVLLDSSTVGGLDSLLVADPLTGNYSLMSKGDYNLDKVISDMHLERLRDIDGSFFSKDTTIEIGKIDPSQFVIGAKKFEYTSDKFPKFNLDDIPVPELKVDDQVIKTGIYKYMPSDLDIGKKVGDIDYTSNLLDISTVADKIPGGIPGDTEISVQVYLSQLGKAEIPLDQQSTVDQSISFGENASQIADVKDFKLKSGGTIKVEFEAVNCPLTGGQIVPNLDLDMSDLFVLSDAVGNKVDLSSIVLKKEDSWKASKSFSISSLAANFPDYEKGKLLLKGLITLEGNINIQNAVSTPNTVKKLSTETMKLKAKLSLNGVEIETMEITLGDIQYDVPQVDIPINITYDLPKEIKSVEKIYLDKDKKFTVDIDAKGLAALWSADKSSHVSIKPEIVVNIPSGLEVEEAVNNQIVIKDQDLFEGKISKTFTLVSLTPVTTVLPSGNKLTYNGTISATIKAKASGTVSSKYLPTKEADDVVITTKMGCKPALKDYDVTFNEELMSRDVSATQDFSFELDGLGDFGKFKVNLAGTPVATIEFSLPATSEIKLVSKPLTIEIPEMMFVDGSKVLIDGVNVPGAFTGHTLTLSGPLPAKVSMPVDYLLVEPKPTEGGKSKVTGSFKVNGTITSDKYQATRKTFDELSEKSIQVVTNTPEFKATTIALQGDFNKSLDYEMKNITILDAQTVSSLPKEVKYIDDVSLEGVNALLELRVSKLPTLTGGFYLKDTKITLPPFIIGAGGTNVLILDDMIPVENNKTIYQLVALKDIKDVQLSGITELKGDFKFSSTLTATTPEVTVSSLQSEIDVHVNVGVGNGSKATEPGKIVISKAEVKVGYNYEQTQSISFGTIPEELQADTVNLALNPSMYVDLTTNFGAPVKGEFEITPYIGGKAISDAVVKISGIELPYSEDPSQTLTNKYAIGTDPSAEPGVTVIAEDLSGLVKRIPDSIKVAINVLVDETKSSVIFPAAQYTCNMAYKFDIPVKFSDKFKLSLNPSVDIDESTSGVFKIAMVELHGVVLSTLPVGADCNIRLLDADGIEIELNRPATLKLQPNHDGQIEPVVLDIKDRENANVRKMLFSIAINITPNVNFNKDQFVQVKELKLVLPNGVTFNAEEE